MALNAVFDRAYGTSQVFQRDGARFVANCIQKQVLHVERMTVKKNRRNFEMKDKKDKKESRRSILGNSRKHCLNKRLTTPGKAKAGVFMLRKKRKLDG